MPEDIGSFVERIVRAAEIPSRRRRDELRRELRSHFEESGLAPDAVDAAVGRFGDPTAIGRSLRKVYRRDYLLLYLVKVGACTAVALLAAILIEAAASIRLVSTGDASYLSPGFAHAAGFGVLLTLALIAAAEATRAPFAWSRAFLSVGCYSTLWACVLFVNANSAGAFVTAFVLAAIGVGCARVATAWIARTLLTLVAFAAVEYVIHRSLGISFGPIRALAASAILLVVSASTIGIVAFSDRAFFHTVSTT
jgi:hypothetical protein